MHWNVNVSHLCNNIANRSLWMGNLINVFYDIRYYDNGKTNLNHHLSLMCFVTWPLFYIFSMKHDVYIHRMTLIDDISWRKCHLWVPTTRISNRFGYIYEWFLRHEFHFLCKIWRFEIGFIVMKPKKEWKTYYYQIQTNCFFEFNNSKKQDIHWAFIWSVT